MIKSMTGYGEASEEFNGVSYSVEIRTLNNRYFKSNIKLPDMMAFLEDDVDQLLKKNLSRGMVSYIMRAKNVGAQSCFEIDQAALRTYLEALGEAVNSLDVNYTISSGSLLSLPGVVQPVIPDEDQAKEIKQAVLSITEKAIKGLMQMRIAEGKALAADLEKNCDAIKKNLKDVQKRFPTVIAEYHDKLKDRVDKLLNGAKLKLDEELLAKEVAIFADRCDISEEVSRLGSHLDQFTKNCKEDGQTGRKLDFLAQEMLREANTIGSKASDSQIALSVVEIKSLIDRLKEQVQNVE